MINCSECCFYDHISLIPNHTFFSTHFNIPEMEMSLAIDDKKALCHSLIGGIFFFFLREVHQITHLTVSGVSVFMKSKQTKARRVLTKGLALLCPEGIQLALSPIPGPLGNKVFWPPGVQCPLLTHLPLSPCHPPALSSGSEVSVLQDREALEQRSICPAFMLLLRPPSR